MNVQCMAGCGRTGSPWCKKDFSAACASGYEQEIRDAFAVMQIIFGKTLFLALTKPFQEG